MNKPRKFTPEEVDAMDDAPTVGLGVFNKPHDIDEVDLAEKIDEQNIL